MRTIPAPAFLSLRCFQPNAAHSPPHTASRGVPLQKETVYQNTLYQKTLRRCVNAHASPVSGARNTWHKRGDLIRSDAVHAYFSNAYPVCFSLLLFTFAFYVLGLAVFLPKLLPRFLAFPAILLCITFLIENDFQLQINLAIVRKTT